MPVEIPKAYEPSKVEDKWFSRWIGEGAFHGKSSSSKKHYSIVIPPPNVTGVLTLGHVLNNTIQDILARRARAEGKEVMWLPGTDHAGIATQSKVERHLRETEGKTRRDLGRDTFLERAWEWKEKHGGIIIRQLKKLGCSCDWDRERFTMDEEYSRQVQDCFIHFFRNGHIYRGKRMVNWCPVSLTALSDEEVIMKPRRSKLYFMRYEIAGENGEFLEIATTRPETLMGDTAVAVNPGDKRYSGLIGKHAVRPFPRAEIPIIADEHIDPEFGTGVLKVTPAHDKADFDIGIRNGLEIIDVLNPDGTLNALAGEEFEGMDRFKARKRAAEKLEEMGLLVRVEEYENSVGYSERADVPVEPRISMQWFLKYPRVKESTAAVAEREIKFRPERWAKTYAHWMENIKDWCISRQLWWGHRIPVWYRRDRAEALQNAESLDNKTAGEALHVSLDPPPDPENWVQDEDVLDTWFSSWLWPFATMDTETKAKFYPTTDLVTGPDIIFFWVARMIMAGYEFTGQKPFSNVFFTSIIRDKEGRKMSKSLGNSPDPLDLIDKYGADALRFSIMRIAPSGTDVRFIENRKKDKDSGVENSECPQVEEGRNFANKLWNACRFRQMQGGKSGPQDGEGSDNLENLSIYDIDILAKLDSLHDHLKRAYEGYKFQEIASRLYDFFWSEFCDWYLESIKLHLREEVDPQVRSRTLLVFDMVLTRYLPLLHPFMPHITEELWEKLGFAREGELLMRSLLSGDPLLAGINPERLDEAQQRTAAVHEATGRARHIKAQYNLAANRKVKFFLEPAVDWVEEELETLKFLCGAGDIDAAGGYQAPAGTPAFLTPLGKMYMPLEGLVDITAERARISKESGRMKKDLDQIVGKLANAKFIERAPKDVVEETKKRRESLKMSIGQLEEMLESLS
jgi:valyl-tRNA synthetase